ncbi:hypothetical protein ACFLTH_11050 [Bacteroidota bacterium]
MNKKGGIGLTFLILVILAVLIWGLVGSEKTKEVGIECDFGWKTSLCWKWENSTNPVLEGADLVTGLVVDKVTEIVIEKAEEKAPEVKDKIIERILDN